jgi:hypothetical protein
MRFIGLIILFAARTALAQAPAPEAAGCNVVTGSLEVNDKGELARPEPTTEQCAAAAALREKLQSMDRSEFRQIVSREAIPGGVYTSISRFGTFGGPWAPYGQPRSDRTDLGYTVSWLTDTLVIIVTETEDFSGPTTTVVIADLESLQVCTFMNWPDNDDPRSISVQDIQQVLNSGLRGDRETPPCHLKPLVID